MAFTNGTMIQFFHWYISNDGTLWKFLKDEAEHLASIGITSAWLPPAFKGMDGKNSHGYDVYDVYDLGEFDQKGSVSTRYGTKEEYLDCIKTLQSKGIKVYVDVVFNHMAGADEIERVTVRNVDPENRNNFIGDAYEIDAHTKFTFPGRKGAYSNFVWDMHCFSGVDYAADLNQTGVFSIQNEYGDKWEEVIDDEKGNFDYLMFADIDYRNEAVREELKRWGKWYLETTGFDGVRLDAIKHMPPRWINEWVDYMRTLKSDLFVVGEYWAPGNLHLLKKYLDATQARLSLFDASQHHNFHTASKSGREYDLKTIFNDSLVADVGPLAVTVIDNHDTQPLQALEAPIEPWFKPIAYALVLLREAGYPCVFFPDIYGCIYTDKGKDGQDYEIVLPKCEHIDELLVARKDFAYGLQRDYFDHPNCIGWTREGMDENPKSCCAVVISNGDDGIKFMEVGKKHTGKTFVEYLKTYSDEIKIDENGWANFLVRGGKVAVWVEK